VLQNLYYTYDPVGNITCIEDDAYEPVFFRNQEVEPKSTYAYDALYRLVAATGRENSTFNNAPTAEESSPQSITFPKVATPNTDKTLRNYTQTYLYDPVGNILRMRHLTNNTTERWTRRYEYAPNSNRLVQTRKGSNPVQLFTYGYDAHGNMLNYDNSIAELQMDWDYRDRVHHINLTLGGGGEAFYQYDSGLERSRKRIEKGGGIVEERLYLGGMEVYRRTRGNEVLEEIETHHLFVDDQRVLMVETVIEANNTIMLDRYEYSNHLGSVGLEADGNGAIISYEEYHPYGTVAYQAVNRTIRATAKRYRYTGMERDEESGLSYHSARYYLPWLGRWLSSDPIGIKGGSNLYAYASSNPILKYDLYGQKPIKSTGTASHPVGSWSYYLKKFRKKYPKLEGHARIYGTPDEGITTKTGIRVPIIEGNTLMPREGYISETAALMAYQGYVHYAELLEAGLGPTAYAEALYHKGRTGENAPPDNVLDLARITNWSYRSANTRDGVLFFTSIGALIRPPKPIGAALFAEEEAAVSRATATQRNSIGAEYSSREISIATGKETFVHSTTRANAPYTAEGAAVNIERTESINLSSGGQRAQWGEGVYAYEGVIESVNITSPKVQFSVSPGTAIERITIAGKETIVRLVPSEGIALKVVNPISDLSKKQFAEALDWIIKAGLGK
jgi:RHS repeat-associated protein